MDIKSYISIILLVIVFIVIFIRNKQDDEQASVEFFASITIGSVLLLIVTLFGSLLYYILFNKVTEIGNNLSPRDGLIIAQCYYTIIYFIVIILFRETK